MSLVLTALDIDKGRLRTARVRALAPLGEATQPQFTAGSDLERVSPDLAPKFTRDTGLTGERFSTVKLIGGPGPELTIKYEYKARPLNGVWASAPFLHNGSVLNLDELLKPANVRLKTFRVGSREFDTEKVGFVNSGDFEFETASQPGNSNGVRPPNPVILRRCVR